MPIDPKHTAVVLIEYQNDFTSEGGALHGAVAAVMEQTGMLENTRRVVAAARAAGATIVHAPITFAPGYGELSEHPYGILKGVVDSSAIVLIALGGFLTNCCVESTMRTGYEKGYDVITLSDCVAATSSEEHENAIRFDYPMFSDVMTSGAFAQALDGAAVSA